MRRSAYSPASIEWILPEPPPPAHVPIMATTVPAYRKRILMPMPRDAMVDWLVDDTADTCSTDPDYLRSILREFWSAKSDDDLRHSYVELAPNEADPNHLDSGPTVTLQFRPQAWIRDYAVDVDPEQPDTWDVPLSLLHTRFPNSDDWHEDHRARDDMRFEGQAPRWIRDWSGPFEVELATEAANPWEVSPIE